MLRELFVLIILGLAAISAAAEETIEEAEHRAWGNSGIWSIKIDPSVGNGCYIEATLSDGTLVQVGFLPDRSGGFFAALNKEWTDIEDGFEGVIAFDFVKTLFEGTYVGIVRGDLHGAYAFFDNPEFLKEFGKRNEVAITGDGEEALSFKLTGTANAINRMRNCDAETSR